MDRQIMDLLDAIRADLRGQVFLVLGQPGSGKSVALRKLTIDLLNEIDQTNRLPLYINLKEWRTQQDADASSQLTPKLFYEWVYQHLYTRYDVLSQQFLENHFFALYKSGHLFFIFDSFDEMPSILDSDEKSDYLRAVSRIITGFIESAPNLRGIVAARYFKRPVLSGRSATTLDIRPFTDEKIKGALERTRRFPQTLLDELFRDRPDLVSMAQNPFSAAMIAEFVKDHAKLPLRQTELFSELISKRLENI